MARQNIRLRKLDPWFHDQKPRCITTTQKGEQCSYSASFVAKTHSGVTVCKLHRDMLILQKGWKFKKIPEERIDIRDFETELRSVG